MRTSRFPPVPPAPSPHPPSPNAPLPRIEDHERDDAGEREGVRSGVPALGSLFAGRYRLLRKLGEGGMGFVFEGVDEKLGRPVALKILKPQHAANEELHVRFEREARAVALLRNRHAVRVFDVDVAPEGPMYIVMELLVGRELGKEAHRPNVRAKHIVEWVAQACDALVEAHANGIVHRDIKPANILLTNDGGKRIAKVLDFGISKFSEHVTRPLTDPTNTILGTPYFMAPEQLRGHRIDGRADLWAIGVTLYRILTTRFPFTADGPGAYMSAVLTQTPFPLDSVRRDLPPELNHLVMRLLERLPADRPSSAEEVAAELRRLDWTRCRKAPGTLPKPGADQPSAPAAPADAVVVADTRVEALPRGARARLGRWALGALAAIAFAAAGLYVVWRRPAPAPSPTPTTGSSDKPLDPPGLGEARSNGESPGHVEASSAPPSGSSTAASETNRATDETKPSPRVAHSSQKSITKERAWNRPNVAPTSTTPHAPPSAPPYLE